MRDFLLPVRKLAARLLVWFFATLAVGVIFLGITVAAMIFVCGLLVWAILPRKFPTVTEQVEKELQVRIV